MVYKEGCGASETTKQSEGGLESCEVVDGFFAERFAEETTLVIVSKRWIFLQASFDTVQKHREADPCCQIHLHCQHFLPSQRHSTHT